MEKQLFQKVIGYSDIKLELTRILDQLADPKKYAAVNVQEPHGLLLHGEPGVGKSTMAMEFLEGSKRNKYICRKNKSNGKFVDEIVAIFDEAEKNAPSVILLDDLDKFANEDESHRDAEEFVTVQACIDRVKDKQVFVVATVNQMYKLPDSLIRAGRFDHVIEIKCPEREDAEEIIAHYMAQKSFMGDIDVKLIARLLEGHSCAELEMVINQAGSFAVFDGSQQVGMKDMIKAILRIIFKAPEKTGETKAGLQHVAYHEAGHALMAELLESGSVNLVTILAHETNITGLTSYYRDDEYFFSKHLMENRVMCLLAGKAATEIRYGVVDTGSIPDLRRAFDIVSRFVVDYCSYGFDQFVYKGVSSNGVLDRRDTRVAAEVANYYNKTRQLLMENRDKLEALACKLLEEKTLLGSQVQEVLKSA